MIEEEEDSLHLHAINFRTAHTLHAEELWQHLKTYVDRLVAAKRQPLTNGEIYTAYITATNQTLRAQDEKLALEFARAIERAHGIGGEHD